MKCAVALAVLVVTGCSEEKAAQRFPLNEARQDKRCAERVGVFQPATGVIGTDAIAKAVALQYLKDIFPEDEHLQPLAATLQNGVWHVAGHLPAGWIGGVANIELCQSNGRVLTVYHTQ